MAVKFKYQWPKLMIDDGDSTNNHDEMNQLVHGWFQGISKQINHVASDTKVYCKLSFLYLRVEFFAKHAISDNPKINDTNWCEATPFSGNGGWRLVEIVETLCPFVVETYYQLSYHIVWFFHWKQDYHKDVLWT